LTALVARGITRRVQQVTVAARHIAEDDLPALVSVARALAAGDLTMRPTIGATRLAITGDDEIGHLGNAFNQMIDELKATEAAFAETSSNLRRLVGQIQESALRLAGTADELEGSTVQTSTTVDQVARAVQQVASGAQDQSSGAQESHYAVTQLLGVIDQVARGAQDQAVSVSTASHNAEQMAAAAEQAALGAQDVIATSHQSHATAEQGALAIQATLAGMSQICEVVVGATEKVEELGVLSERIGSVVEVINDIAERTNMLALNAAIEAARAGEHGRGFAVVAEEVKNLAERSQNETRTIAQLVREVQLGTRAAVHAMEESSQLGLRGVDQADEAGRALAEILAAAENAAEQVGEIAGTAQDLAAYSREVSAAISRISMIAEEASAASEQMTASAESAGHAISGIAAVAEEHSAVAEEVSASAVDVSHQVEQMSVQARELAVTAEQLRGLVSGFKLETGSAAPRPTQDTPRDGATSAATPLPTVRTR
jgi:methyl-accepting chemotaxis protein